jgi:MFS family permease
MRDRRLLLAAAFLRALATGMIGVLAGLYLARLEFSPAQIGLVVSVGLAGAALAALLVTWRGDRLGRRRALVALAAFGAAGGATVALATHPWVIGCAAFFGMLNGMGRDRGAALVLDQAILPSTTDDRGRTTAFAWYNLLQDAGHALGSLAAGLPSLLHHAAGVDELTALRAAVGLYAAIVLATGVVYLALSPAAEAATAGRGAAGSRGAGAPPARAPLSPASRRIVWRIASLFALDSLGGGFLTATLLSFFFFERFGTSPAAVGALFFAARIANALSHLAAAWLAKRIGLVNTMVFTHIPSSLLLLTVAVAPSFPVAAALFILREGLVEMDVPTRQSYVVAVVKPEERTVATGITHLVRLGGWAVAPAFAGMLMSGTSLAAPLIAGAGMKIAYDVMLYLSFRGVRPPEER